MTVRKSEVLRYLGYGKVACDTVTDGIIDEVIQRLMSDIIPHSVFREFPVDISGGVITVGGDSGMKVQSRGLCTNLDGCNSAILFAATLGVNADAAVRRYSMTSMSHAAAAQAVATEMIESYCDEIIDTIRADKLLSGLFLRPRFSPGYGDFGIEHQLDFFRMLDITKRLGLSLSDELIMTPTKSVTAVIGLSDRHGTADKGCNACNKKDCEYRDES